jgi:crotonobetainyl-CoA:carnitine CoA-transferase CaiB-like acyl-CoA transferase
MKNSALAGLKVLEFGDFISAPYCGKLFADLGAEVVKVERPGAGDSARRWGPFPGRQPHPEKSGLFLFLNSNKYGVTLDVTAPAGVEVFKKLVARADVLVESHPPSLMASLGLTWDVLQEVNPSLVMTSITPFGQDGPYRDYKGNDLIAAHTSGEAFGNPAEGVDDLEKYCPLKGPVHAADFMTGLTAAVSTMPEVLARRVTGRGRHLDISAQEALASVLRQELAFCLCEGLCPTRELGRKRRGGILYPARDGYVCIWIGPHYPKLVKMIGEPDWTRAEPFRTLQGREKHTEDFDRLMALWTKERTVAEIDALAVEYGVPCSPVRSVADVLADDQLAYRDYFVRVEHPVAGTYTYPGAPYKLSATPWSLERPAPLLGQHNEDMYVGKLGFSREELASLRREGVI